jgi:hypothetical protein
MSRRTIKVVDLIDKANKFFELSPDSAKIDRIAVADFISQILHDTGNYAGFSYLRDYYDPANDSTRVFYYTHHNLK